MVLFRLIILPTYLFLLPSFHHPLFTTLFSLPSFYYPLLTTLFLLPSSHYPLFTTLFLLPSFNYPLFTTLLITRSREAYTNLEYYTMAPTPREACYSEPIAPLKATLYRSRAS